MFENFPNEGRESIRVFPYKGNCFPSRISLVKIISVYTHGEYSMGLLDD